MRPRLPRWRHDNDNSERSFRPPPPQHRRRGIPRGKLILHATSWPRHYAVLAVRALGRGTRAGAPRPGDWRKRWPAAAPSPWKSAPNLPCPEAASWWGGGGLQVIADLLGARGLCGRRAGRGGGGGGGGWLGGGGPRPQHGLALGGQRPAQAGAGGGPRRLWAGWAGGHAHPPPHPHTTPWWAGPRAHAPGGCVWPPPERS